MSAKLKSREATNQVDHCLNLVYLWLHTYIFQYELALCVFSILRDKIVFFAVL